MKQYAAITVIGKDKTGASWPKPQFKVDLLQTGLAGLAKELAMEIQVHLYDLHKKPRMALLVTKEPHCLETLAAAVKSGKLKAEPSVVIGNRTTLAPLAQKLKLPFVHIPYDDRAKAELAILNELKKREIDFIVLARFMKILSPNFVWRWKNKIINIHPSLLPAFPGASAYWQAYEKGVKIVGVTSHFVTVNLDEGPIIWQESFKVLPADNLKSIIAKGQKLESKTLLKAIQLFLDQRLDVHWGKVHRTE